MQINFSHIIDYVVNFCKLQKLNTHKSKQWNASGNNFCKLQKLNTQEKKSVIKLYKVLTKETKKKTKTEVHHHN